jgi:hypothetical protein
MNLNTIYKHVQEIAGETAWILEKMEEYVATFPGSSARSLYWQYSELFP